MTSIPSRRPPPPPPRRNIPLYSKDSEIKEDFCGETSSVADSGISESSSVSSLPMVTSSALSMTSSFSALSVTASPEKMDNNSNFSKLSFGSEMYAEILAEISGTDMEVSVVSLPSSYHREVDSEAISTSPVMPKKNLRRPPPPPVRSDSIKKSTRKTLLFEEKFKFNSPDIFPPPLPLSIEKKSYPTKELFSCPSPKGKEEVEEEELPPVEPTKKKGKKHQRLSLDPASMFSRLKFGTKTPNSKSSNEEATASSTDHQRFPEDSMKENSSGGERYQIKKPPIGKKPVIDRTISSAVLSPRRQERGICRSLSMASPSPSRQRSMDGCSRGVGRESRKEMVARPAPPPPPPPLR